MFELVRGIPRIASHNLFTDGHYEYKPFRNLLPEYGTYVHWP